MRYASHIARGLAVAIGITAVYVLIRHGHWRGALDQYSSLITRQDAEPRSSWQFLLMLTFDIVIVTKMVAAVGLFFYLKWAWCVAVLSLSGDVVLRVAGIVNMWTADRKNADMSVDLAEAPVVEISYSIYPIYILLLVSVASLIVLISRPVRSFLLREYVPRADGDGC